LDSDILYPSLAELCPWDGLAISTQRATLSWSVGSGRALYTQQHRYLESVRPYQPGDSVRFIDWRAYARLDQLLVRQARRPTKREVVMTLATHSSMDWPHKDLKSSGGKAVPPSKLAVGLRLILALSYALMKNGDRVLMLLATGSTWKKIEIQSSSQILEMFHLWEHKGFLAQEVRDLWPTTSVLGWERADTVIVVTDGMEEDPTLVRWQNENTPSEKHFVHLLSSWEVDARWIDKQQYIHESPASLKLYNADSLSKHYDAERHRWCRQIAERVEALGASYSLLHDRCTLMDMDAVCL
jgi:hypothetical protein